MKHIPSTTRIFIGLVAITFLLTYIALTLSTYKADMIQSSMNNTLKLAPQAQENKVDIKDWQQYIDKAYPIAFSYPKDWTIVTAIDQDKFYDITLQNSQAKESLHIYISMDGSYALEGTNHVPSRIGNRIGVKAADNLLGIKVGEYYYTFDAATAPSSQKEFTTLLSTIAFQ
jgi:hypothetical protein